MNERRCRDLVNRRAGGRCEWCGRWGGTCHHRLPRGMGGTSLPHWSPARLLLLCGHGTAGCHGAAESNRAWAQAVGLIVARPAPGADLVAVLEGAPVLLLGRRWVLLTGDGRYVDAPVPPGPGLSAAARGPGSQGAPVWPF